jgi:hypothetical protein
MATIRQSDFSIDHILNRAGASKCCDTNIGDLQKTLGSESYQQIADQPIFDWIYYTRYRPPKLPSKYMSELIYFSKAALVGIAETSGQQPTETSSSAKIYEIPPHVSEILRSFGRKIITV